MRKKMTQSNITYTATLTLTSVGDSANVVLENVSMMPDISEEDIERGNIPWAYKIMAYLINHLKRSSSSVQYDLSREIMGDDVEDSGTRH